MADTIMRPCSFTRAPHESGPNRPSLMSPANRVIVLCTGLQGSGSSLISWCFLQRCDTDGALDACGDAIVRPPKRAQSSILWYKTTISSFRTIDLIRCAEDDGYTVKPLLIVRDVRVAWASLIGKPYGINGTTAEDPPLRLRFRRFLDDWRTFQEHGWPILSYEQFVRSPEESLRTTCEALEMSWDSGMVDWPKPAEEIADARHGNRTFRSSRGRSLSESLAPERVEEIRHPIAQDDLAWLEREFVEFNTAHGYPRHREVPLDTVDRLVPQFDGTRRMKWRLHQKPLKLLLHKLRGGPSR